MALQEKKKHDKANARKLIAIEASEKEAQQQEKQEKQIAKSIYQIPLLLAFRPPLRSSPSPPATQLAPPAIQSVSQSQKSRNRLKGSKNSASTSSTTAPPSSSAPPVLTTSKSDRQIKEKKVWEQEKGLSQKRLRGSTLDTTLQPAMQPIKKKSKQNLVPSKDVDKRESQQQRILNTAYLVGDPYRSEK